ncbi:uncharacterized protein [Rutidosis leptorrhynchoides]|uniref:uncharacterized protein n=1 Tax=Rutidosis leptorrhynchoides TaxID=125765 RepID=UPI003A98D770
MGSNMLFIRDITPRKVNFSIRVKVMKIQIMNGKGYDFGKDTMELIVVDEQGDRIGVNIRHMLKPKFESALREHHHYILRNVAIVDNPVRYRSIHWNHETKLMFTHKSTIIPFESSQWTGLEGFNFIQFSDLKSPVLLKAGVTADVIGRVNSYGNIKQRGQTDDIQSKFINFELKDLSDVVVSCTLWGQFCLDFYNHMKKAGEDQCVIVLIQFGTTKDYCVEDQCRIKNIVSQKLSN